MTDSQTGPRKKKLGDAADDALLFEKHFFDVDECVIFISAFGIGDAGGICVSIENKGKPDVWMEKTYSVEQAKLIGQAMIDAANSYSKT